MSVNQKTHHYYILFNQEADNLNLIIEKNTHHPLKPTTQTQSFPTFLKTLYTHSIPPPLSSTSSSDPPRFHSIKNPNIPQQFLLGLWCYKEGKKGLHFLSFKLYPFHYSIYF
ncbi:hypothetical protein L1987_73984 [Smallanthus sonchifolius]|uniref:Uncharacterized protein n=1 Tax=Smallanthus sonchifolius TaxID=185202 RepID=A0ACB9A1F9_9ASTR|nr:hypothetical protein L1987_73984 [Smallanthus sonchifolius]